MRDPGIGNGAITRSSAEHIHWTLAPVRNKKATTATMLSQPSTGPVFRATNESCTLRRNPAISVASNEQFVGHMAGVFVRQRLDCHIVKYDGLHCVRIINDYF